MATDIGKVLEEATRDLLYQSESDEPFEVVRLKFWQGNVVAKELAGLCGASADAPVSEVALEEFFAPLLQEMPWHGLEEKADRDRYARLREILQKHLSDLRVVRIGDIQVHVYVLGKTTDGAWTGLKTIAVET